jgi:hypothetical protein
VVADAVANTGAHVWAPGTGLEVDRDYYLEIVWDEYPSVRAQTQQFALVKGTLLMLAPLNGRFRQGAAVQLEWSSDGLAADRKLKLELYRDALVDSRVLTIATAVDNTGSFPWRIPGAVDPAVVGNCRSCPRCLVH